VIPAQPDSEADGLWFGGMRQLYMPVPNFLVLVVLLIIIMLLLAHRPAGPDLAGPGRFMKSP
jgi:hypothetical protein